jgi:hypothetical protein
MAIAFERLMVGMTAAPGIGMVVDSIGAGEVPVTASPGATVTTRGYARGDEPAI